MKNILIVGCYRSGTTALFNIARLVLKHTGQDFSSYFWEGNIISGKEYQLIKTHAYNTTLAKNAYKIFIAHRELSEVKKSMIALQKFTIQAGYTNAANLEYLDTMQNFAKLWMDQADYVQHFDTLINNPIEIVESLLKELQIPYIDKQVSMILNEFKGLKAPKQGHDNVTLLGETHKKFQ